MDSIPRSLLLLCSLLPLPLISSNPPQNIQTFPSTAVPAFSIPPPAPPFSSPPAHNSSTSKKVRSAVLATAASTFLLSALLFFAFHHFFRRKPHPSLSATIVDDNGLDAIYWRSLHHAGPTRCCDHCSSLLRENALSPPDRSQRLPLLSSNSINSSSIAFAAAQPTPPPPPPPPPPPAKKAPGPPPPPPARRAGGPPPPPQVPDGGKERPRLKPLHWDKVTPANAGHSMVWDKITDGSIRFDDDMMEALFGYVATNRKSQNSGEPSAGGASPKSSPAEIRLLDPRRSQNIAIILRSLAASREDILEGLQDGRSLPSDAVEKLSRISPSPDEETLILSFGGNPSLLADAESFLFHILRAVPSAFPRISALHFRRSVYEPEILHLRQSFRTLDLACTDLRAPRDLFLKLLEAILKAGNRMNAGTARGNAQAFDLTALRKLADVKSTDGRTTLLHFVVEEVVRSEGKRCAAVNRSCSIRRSGSRTVRGGAAEQQEAQRQAREEREREYVMLGLPIVGGLSVDFTNVKKAAAIDHDSVAGGCESLKARVGEIRLLVRSWGEEEEEGEFVKEMGRFVEAAAEEIGRVEEERMSAMDKVRRTIEYYQPAAAKDNAAKPLQLFVIVRDFLGMVDQACVDITRNLQKKKKKQQQPSAPPAAVEEAPERLSEVKLASLKEERITTRFPNLPVRFLSDNAMSCSDSEEEDGF